MKRIIRAWNKTNLIKRIGIGMTLGAILGLLVPNLTGIGLLGDLFVGGLKAIAPRHCTHKMRHKKTLLLKSGKIETGVFCYGQKSIFSRN